MEKLIGSLMVITCIYMSVVTFQMLTKAGPVIHLVVNQMVK